MAEQQYYAKNPVDGYYYTTDASGNPRYSTPLPVNADGVPISPNTGSPLNWTEVGYKNSEGTNASDSPSPNKPKDPLTTSQPPQQDPVTTQTQAGPGIKVGPPTVTVTNPGNKATPTTSVSIDSSGNGIPKAGSILPTDRPLYWFDGTVIKEANAKGYLYELQKTNPAAYSAIVDRMAKAGWDISSPSKVQDNWEKIISRGADSYASGLTGQSGRTALDPGDIIDLTGDAKAAKAAAITVENVNNLTKSLKISSESEAKAALTQVSQQLLGRDPSGKELRIFTQALNALQQQNPEYTKTTGQRTAIPGAATQGPTVDGQPTVIEPSTTSDTTTSTTTGGLDVGQYTTDWAKSRPDYAEYQAATTYMDALLSAIQSPVKI